MADMIEVRVKNPLAFELFERKIASVMKKTRPLMHAAGLYFEREARRAFNTSGASTGSPWDRLRPKTMKSRKGTPKIRYGTNKTPKRTRSELADYKSVLMSKGKWRVGQIGKLPGYKSFKRYGPQSRPLVSSRGFAKSWQLLKVTRRRALVGTTFPAGLASAIIKGRPVLVVTPKAKRHLNRLLRKWIREKVN